MTVQIDQIFTARAESVWQFLHAAGQGCYIPAYQRPYAWDDENVDRLIDDVLNGLNHLVDRSSAISFLGTIIAIHDTNLVTVKPVYQAEVAQRVMSLIDGQQRISTSVMMNVALHHHLSALESVQKVVHFEHSLRSIRRMDANFRKASALRDKFSKSLASLRHRPSHAKVRSTTQRLGRTSKPFAVSDRLTISVARPGLAFF